MHHPRTTRRAAGLRLAALTALALLAGCQTPRGIVADGSVDDWRRSDAAAATADDLFVRFRTTREMSVQAADVSTRLMLDLDGDPSTGRRLEGPDEVGTLGVDLEVVLSPRDDETAPAGVESSLASGVAAFEYSPAGERAEIGHAACGFRLSPSHSADWFEARLDRHAPAMASSRRTAPGDPGRGVVLSTDAAGEIVGFTDGFAIDLPPSRAARPLADTPVPPPARGSIRVLSYNVLRASPLQDPEPFGRVLRATAPDVVLLQEIDRVAAAELESWFNEHAGPSAAGWRVVARPEKGVAVATPHEIAAAFDSSAAAGGPADPRAVAALVSTPAGEVLAASVHLKCCGSMGSPEDETRLDEAAAVRAMLADVTDAVREQTGADATLVLGGDVNLVGSPGPLDLLCGRPGDGCTPLTPVTAARLGDPADRSTWRNDRGAFAPGRLDWILIPERVGVTAAEAFVLDTRLLSEEALLLSGLRGADTDASDHLPVIVDVIAP